MQNSEFIYRFGLFSRLAALLAIATGISTLIGWWLDITLLKSILPNLVTLKPNAAVCFIAIGSALFIVQKETIPPVWQYSAIGLALSTIGIASLTLLEYLLKIDLGIDQLLFSNDIDAIDTFYPGRMPIATTICFILLSTALLLINRFTNISQYLALIALIIVSSTIIGYVFKVPALYRIDDGTARALSAAITFFVLSLGIYTARNHTGYMKILVSDSVSGLMARSMLPLAPTLLFTLICLSLWGKNTFQLDTSMTLALLALTAIITIVYIIMYISKILYKVDFARQQTLIENTILLKTISTYTRELEVANTNLTTEVNERKNAEEQVRQLSITDELTGLLNRRGFFLLAEQALKNSQRGGQGMSLLYIDLDGLKKVNDNQGHKMGDIMIQNSAQVIKSCFRDADIVSRIGGDEFVILNINESDTDIQLKRLKLAMDQFNRLTESDTSTSQLSFSIGAANYFPSEHKSLLDLLAEADTMMYQQKQEHHAKNPPQ